MSDTDKGQELLREIRDLLQEDVRLRRSAIEEQREGLAAARKSQRTLMLVLLILFLLFFGSSLVWPILTWVLGAAMPTSQLGAETLVPSQVDTTRFDGEYALVAEESFGRLRAQVGTTTGGQREAGEQVLSHLVDQYGRFQVRGGVIRSGTTLVQEFSLTRAEVDGDTLNGLALWHEDVGDPGDASTVPIRLRLQGNRLEFAILDEQDGLATDTVVLERSSGGTG